ncbi:unnamed protein product [Ilex paraguariensis]|uniref:Cyanobacterial aminoacyl-tRNA synthetase CAAD domain-containing protein n=1 Tax=Ilex paraguariensis TaxID=185542 RepID=A0ABC8UA14_9AQUA
MATASSMAQALVLPGLFTGSSYSHCSAVPMRRLPPRTSPTSSFSASYKPHFSTKIKRLSLFKIKASSSEETSESVEGGEVFSNLKDKWDAIENKSTVVLYGGGAVVAVWLSAVIVDAFNSIPVFPKIMEVVGLGYTGWFIYRYLLFKSGRKELASDIEDLKKKIAGNE